MRRIAAALLCFASLALISSAQVGRAPSSPRMRIRMDADWRFRRDNPPAKTKQLNWQWKVAEVPSLNVTKLPADLADGQWASTTPGEDVFKNRLGFAWYRTTIPAAAANGTGPLVLHFDGIDDNAAIYLNGVRLTTHFGWDEEFDVPLDSAWRDGEANELVVLVQNTAGQGGISGSAGVHRTPPEQAPNEANSSYDDTAWRMVHLPHDYVVEGTFAADANTGHGSLPVIPAWYRHTFTVPKTAAGKSVWIDFDGIFRDSTVYLNGKKLGNWASGYAPSRYDLSKVASYTGKNVLAVRVDPRKFEGWWYEGGGIYRHVWLNIADPVHVRPWGVSVRPKVLGPEGQARPDADVAIGTTIDNKGTRSRRVEVYSQVVGPDGRAVGSARATRTVAGGASLDLKQTVPLKQVDLWSIEKPALYSLVTTVQQGGRILDRTERHFGIRTIRWDKDQGFFLNGKHVLLKGTCNHQDFAGVGIAMPDGLLEWRIQKLKEMGSNAYRCSHNPPASELLDACDRLGMVVMDETRHFGDAQGMKTQRGTKASDLSELRRLILRDRNHPSVIMWSMENEEPLQGTEEGAQIFSAMAKVVKELDPTRQVTSAMNGGWGRGLTHLEDLLGMNYGIDSYDRVRAENPSMPMYGSETASAVATRGIYSNDRVKGYVSAYDTQTPGSYAATAEQAWRAIAERPWMGGAFVWTGFDYKGEPSPYGWPCINSHFGIMDMCGFPKDTYYYYQSWWSDKPVVHILPHWTWRGSDGHPIPVWVFSNADEVELFLNGKSLGRKMMRKNGHLEWVVPYTAGSLVAKGYTDGKLIGRDQVETAGAPVAIELRALRSDILRDHEDVVPVEVRLVDAKGRVVPTAQNPVTFSVSGPARVVGVGNGDPSSHEPDKASSRKAFNGLCMAIVGDASGSGAITLTASSPGLKGARVVISMERGRPARSTSKAKPQ